MVWELLKGNVLDAPYTHYTLNFPAVPSSVNNLLRNPQFLASLGLAS